MLIDGHFARVLPIDPEENVKFIIGYPQFYEKDEETGMSIMDLVKECYERKESIEGFLEEAYEVVEGYCGR